MIKTSKILGLLLVIISISIPVFFVSMNMISDNIYKVKIENKLINQDDYFAVLEIPNIDLKRELFNIDDEKNNINNNVLVHENSIFPSKPKSNVILASHSGNGGNAYFKYLYKLNVGDTIKLYHNNILYEYEIKEIEFQKKTGDLYLKQDYDNMITLITCTYNNRKTQTIYYAQLKNSQNIEKI